MGEVYRARDESLGREVAVKILPGALASDPERLRRFEQEAKAAAALSHPNILVVYGFGTTDSGIPYLVAELLQGQTLRERLQPGPLSVRKTVEYACQIARGMAAAHDRGITHRDIKPENLFVTRDGLVKILDFGLAKLTRPESPNAETTLASFSGTEAGIILGTAGYMSPEQVRGLPADARSDIFSLGAVCYEMVSGKRAFQGATAADTMSMILKKSRPTCRAVLVTYRQHWEGSSTDVWKKIREKDFNLREIWPSIWRYFREMRLALCRSPQWRRLAAPSYSYLLSWEQL
jgi:serine/threonine protein kinase